jgi:hypothetical protein
MSVWDNWPDAETFQAILGPFCMPGCENWCYSQTCYKGPSRLPVCETRVLGTNSEAPTHQLTSLQNIIDGHLIPFIRRRLSFLSEH